ncbi:MAG: alpha/beta hydrolase [Actinomycetes bacterium]
MALTPEISQYLEGLKSIVAPELWQAPVAVHRRNRMGRVALSGTPEKIYQVDHQYIAGPTSDLPIRIYRPHARGPLPAMVFFHGGGWVLNTLDIYEQELRSFANKGQFIVIAVGYQKAPEHAFPIPYDDCYATLEWVVANATNLGIDSKQIGVGGDSAGANLAAAVALKARDEDEIDLAFQLLLYPCNDYEMGYASAEENGVGYGLTTASMKWFWQAYLQRPADQENPYAVPIKAANFLGLPPTIVVTAEFDPLLDDGYNYAQLLKQDGVLTIYREYAGMIHGFMTMAAVTGEAVRAQQDAVDEINALLDRQI